MRFILCLMLITQMGCSFITTAAGSFVGNLGADLVEEKIKDMKDKEKEDVRRTP